MEGGSRWPRYGQHRLHQLKRLLIQLPQQHQQRPLILCNEYPLNQPTLSTIICINQHFCPSYKETTFHLPRASWRQIRVDRGLSVLLSGRRPNYDTDIDLDMRLRAQKGNFFVYFQVQPKIVSCPTRLSSSWRWRPQKDSIEKRSD